MNIIETNLTFSALINRTKTNRIILHHAEASKCTAQDIHSWHKANGWAGAGYHFLVRKDGKIYRLRPEYAVGAHAVNNNSDSIGICFEGAFNKEIMCDAQLKAGAELIKYLKDKYKITKVLRHKDVGSTDCPGNNFPFQQMLNLANETKTTVSNTVSNKNYKTEIFAVGELKVGDTGNEVLLLQEILKARDIYKGKLDKDFGKETMNAVNAYQQLRMSQGVKIGNGKGDGICGTDMWKDLIAL